MDINLHSTMCADMVVNNNLDRTRAPDDIIFIVDFSSHYVMVANIFKNFFAVNIVEAVSKLLIEDMVVEYIINKELEGGMFWENMRETIIFDLGEHKILQSIIIDEYISIIDENYELLDVIFGEVYGKLTHVIPRGLEAVPIQWTGDGNINSPRVSAKITMISNPDLILST